MPRPLIILSQSDSFIQTVNINSGTKWQTVQIHIRWILQKPTDLDLHCLQRQGISWLSRTKVNYSSCKEILDHIKNFVDVRVAPAYYKVKTSTEEWELSSLFSSVRQNSEMKLTVKFYSLQTSFLGDSKVDVSAWINGLTNKWMNRNLHT